MTKDEYIALYEKYLTGNCTAAEIKLIENYEDDFQLSDSTWDQAILGDKDNTKKEIFNRLEKSINTPVKNRLGYKWIAAAAVIILLSAVGLMLSNNNQNTTSPAIAKHTYNAVPGTDKATLTLADGTTIILNKSKSGLISSTDAATVSITKEGVIVYKSDNPLAATAAVHTISTPNGGRYQVVLPDGTNVWLNAASSISFPTIFKGKDRRVTLTGEAYFEVAKNKKMPFIVSSDKANVKVLGTHFNMMAYNDENSIQTTLIEGSVEVSQGGATHLITPGQQASISRTTDKFEIAEVDTEEIIAWKNGFIQFNNTSPDVIMRQISRWYDVDLYIVGNAPDDRYRGKISRNENLAEVLKILELNGLNIKVRGRKTAGTP